MYGYVGKVLWVDLSHNKTHVSELKLSIFQKYLGGLGVASKIMLEYTDAKVDPYSPDNLLIFMTGPVAGTIVPTGSRYVLVTKSPLTGYMAQSWSGSYFANQIKFSGYDGIVVRGKANKPVYLWIEDGKVEFKDATHLWGKSTYEVDDLVKEEVRNPDAGVACIGPAGERLVRFACIMNDKYSAAGRGGVGAVMGSKNLKAIAVYGTHDVEVANMDELLKVVSEAYDRIKRNDVTGKIFPKYGTLANVSPVNEAGVFPTRNYQNGYFEEIGKINENVVVEKYLFKNCACHSCPVGCQKRFIIYENGRPIITEGPEYETLWAFSANCGNSDMKTVIKANDLCNSYGLDTISTGGVIAFAMECYEKGLLSKKDLDGQDFRFGNSQAIIEAIRKIAFREGYGDLLAEGVKRVADRLGAHDFAMHVKGQEMPAYDPRGLMGMGLAYATSNRGACHNRAWVVGLELYTDMDRFTTKGKAEVCKYVQDSTAIKDSLIMCHFLFSINNPALDFEWISRMLRALTGLTFSEKDLLLIGERIWNLGRIYNVLAGMRSEEDNLPKRLLREPLPSGVSRGRIVKLEEMLNEYYKVRKWDKETGLPRIQKMEELGMHEIVGVLKEKGYLCKE